MNIKKNCTSKEVLTIQDIYFPRGAKVDIESWEETEIALNRLIKEKIKEVIESVPEIKMKKIPIITINGERLNKKDTEKINKMIETNAEVAVSEARDGIVKDIMEIIKKVKIIEI